jgi:hypothetical protein
VIWIFFYLGPIIENIFFYCETSGKVGQRVDFGADFAALLQTCAIYVQTVYTVFHANLRYFTLENKFVSLGEHH